MDVAALALLAVAGIFIDTTYGWNFMKCMDRDQTFLRRGEKYFEHWPRRVTNAASCNEACQRECSRRGFSFELEMRMTQDAHLMELYYACYERETPAESIFDLDNKVCTCGKWNQHMTKFFQCVGWKMPTPSLKTTKACEDYCSDLLVFFTKSGNVVDIKKCMPKNHKDLSVVLPLAGKCENIEVGVETSEGVEFLKDCVCGRYDTVSENSDGYHSADDYLKSKQTTEAKKKRYRGPFKTLKRWLSF